jgi:hypothetical protein
LRKKDTKRKAKKLKKKSLIVPEKKV